MLIFISANNWNVCRVLIIYTQELYIMYYGIMLIISQIIAALMRFEKYVSE